MDIDWNGVSSATIPELVFSNPIREMLGSHRGSFLEIPGRTGAWYYPNVRGRRLITVPGFIQASTWPAGRRNAVTAVADWLDQDAESRLILGDDPSVFYLAVITDPGDVTEWRELGSFQLVWNCQPYSFAINPSVSSHVVDQSQTDVFDLGNLVTLAPVIVITPTNGTITAFNLTLNGDTLQWAGGTIALGNSLTINSISSVVTTGMSIDIELTGAYVPGDLSMTQVYGAFPFVRPGSNTLTYSQISGTATVINIDINYRLAYRK